MMKRAWIALVCAAGAGGCTDASETSTTTTTDSDALSAPVSAADGLAAKRVFEHLLQAAEAERSARATQVGYTAAVDEAAAADVVYSATNYPLERGVAAMRAVLDAGDPDHAVKATFVPHRITVSADGELGATFGLNTFTTVAADGSTTVTYGSYTTVWRRVGLRWTEIVVAQNPLDSLPPAPPAGFALLDATPPVFGFASAATNAKEVAATDVQFAAASVAEGGAIAIPAFAAQFAAEDIYGGVFYGIDQVTSSHAGDPTPDEAALNWAPTDAVSTFTGDFGYTDGNYVVELAGSNEVVAQGTYLTVYQRGTDGGWHWSIANSNPSPITE